MLVAEILSSLTIRDDSTGPRGDEDEIEELKAGLAAEEGGPRSAKAARRLKFDSGMWEGEGEGKEECRWLRECVGVDDLNTIIQEDPTGEAWLFGWTPSTSAPSADSPMPKPSTDRRENKDRGRPHTQARSKNTKKEKLKPQPKVVLLDSDQEQDPLQSYVPDSPSSSRSPSPTPSYLEEVAQDPTLSLDTSQKKKLTRPVYVQQLITLLKEREKPEHIEMGLKWGEGLVRAKRSFGTELCEYTSPISDPSVSLGKDSPWTGGRTDMRQPKMR